jgi:hypothetical protein
LPTFLQVALGGLIYDLERSAIVGMVPRSDMLHVPALDLTPRWEQREDELWVRQEYLPGKLACSKMTQRADQRKLNPQQHEEARRLIAEGKSLREVAAHFGVSRMAVWRSVAGRSRWEEERRDI